MSVEISVNVYAFNRLMAAARSVVTSQTHNASAVDELRQAFRVMEESRRSGIVADEDLSVKASDVVKDFRIE